MSFYVGQLARINVTVTNPVTKTKVDPATVIVTVADPSGVTSKPPVTKDATGEDHAIVEWTKPGTWHITVTTTGEYQGVETTEVSVKRAPTP